MAFSIITQPAGLLPVGNDLTFRVFDDSNYTKTSFKYNFYTYVEGNLVNTTKLYPRTDGYCNFNPSFILKQYLSSYFTPTLTTSSNASSSEIITYKVVFKVEYETAGVLSEYLMSAGTNKLVWNGVAQWNDAMNISSYVNSLMPVESSTPTTNLLNYRYYPTSYANAIKIGIQDKRNISFFRRNTNSTNIVNSVKVTTSGPIGSKIFSYTLPVTSLSTTTYINHFPVGINELNGISWTSITGPGSPIIVPSEDTHYTVELIGTSDPCFKPLRFQIKDYTHCVDDHYTIIYRTLNGGFGYINFDKRKFKSVSVSQATFDKFLPYNYTTSSRVTTVYGNSSVETIVLNTDWIETNEEVQELLELFLSPEIYVSDANGIIVPVLIKDTNFNIVDVDTDELTQYQFTFSEAFKKNLLV